MTASAGWLAPPVGASAARASAFVVAAGCTPRGAASAPSHPLGIQLYTLRTLMAADPEAVFAALAEFGYAEVEFAGLHGRSPAELRALLDRHGLRAPSGHYGLSDFETDAWPHTLETAAALGHEYVVVPWIDARDRTLDGFLRIADRFNELGALARGAGLRFAYHNHDFEFSEVDGRVPYDLLLERTDPAFVEFQIDVFWMRAGGRDPLDYFATHPGRFPMLHLKDMAADGEMVDVGDGVIDLARVIAAAAAAGARHYFLEHDRPASPLDFARAGYAHVRPLLH